MSIEIFIPFWGEPRLLFETLASVQAQTCDDWRAVVLDDAYPDDTVGDRVRALGDPRVTYLRNDTNLGIIENFRRCRELATGDVVSFLGCDDVLLPGYVEVVLEALDAAPEASFVQPGVQVIDADGALHDPLADRIKHRLRGPAGELDVRGGEELYASLMRGNWLYWPSLAFRRSALADVDFRPDLEIALDLALVLDLIVDGHRLVLDPRLCFSYRRHAASLSSASAVSGGRFAEERAFFADCARRAEALGWDAAARAALRRPVSRLHALSLLPSAVRRPSQAGPLLRHAFGRTR